MPKIVSHKERRQLLASTAGNLIASKGLAKATIREVARAAGVSTGTVSHYYCDSKELLHAAYAEAFESTSRRFIDVLNEDHSFEGLLTALYSALPLEEAVVQEWNVRLAFWGAGDFALNIKNAEEVSSENFRKLVARKLDNLNKSGEISLGTTSKNAARTIEVLIIGTAIECMVLRNGKSSGKSNGVIRNRLKEQITQGILQQ